MHENPGGKGIVLAGGLGKRLYPLTLAVSKQLMPVYDKPMIYYPITTLMLAGIRDFLLITTPHDEEMFKRLLGDGSQWGISISFATQSEPNGIAEAFVIGRDFISSDHVALVLGDNIFHGDGLGRRLSELPGRKGATVFALEVASPERYGVIEFDRKGHAVAISEKPKKPKSKYAIPGLYFYDNRVLEIAEGLKPSARGELEITDINIAYLDSAELHVESLGPGVTWFDAGTPDSLLEASEFIRILEQGKSTLIGSPEEVAWRLGYITDQQLLVQATRVQDSKYGHHLFGMRK